MISGLTLPHHFQGHGLLAYWKWGNKSAYGYNSTHALVDLIGTWNDRVILGWCSRQIQSQVSQAHVKSVLCKLTFSQESRVGRKI